MLKWPYQIILLCIVVFGVYYPTLSAEVSLVDDQDAIVGVLQADNYTLRDIFLPGVEEGGYYRPLIGLSYYLDKKMWGMNFRSLHLDNILMHLINVILVYYLTLVVYRGYVRLCYIRPLPLITALLFALHPIATESVNWISGRTDPMAANFVLSAAIFLVLYKQTGKKINLFLSIVLVILGSLAKEASLGMVLASGLILYSNTTERLDDQALIPRTATCSHSFRDFLVFYILITIEVLYWGNYWLAMVGALVYALCCTKPWISFQASRIHIFRLSGILALSGTIVLLIYTVLRRIAFRSDVSKIGQTIRLMLDDTNYAISLYLGASGFYLKKFFLPFPLNFYLIEIDPLYDLLGILVLLFCIYLITRLTLASALFLTGVCMFIPALPFAFGTIAWTGYAERYIYIATAFWTVSVSLYLENFVQKYAIVGRVCTIVVPALILFLGWQTFLRNIVWQKNVTLLADTVEKSPMRPVVREMYMQALMNAGKYEQAKEQYEIGTSRLIFLSEGPDLIMVQILAKEGKFDEALLLSEKAVKKTNNRSERALKAVVGVLDVMIGKNNLEQTGLLQKRIKYESLLLETTKDPMLFYNKGQQALGSGDRLKAISFFNKAYNNFSSESPYRGYSLKIINCLKKEVKK